MLKEFQEFALKGNVVDMAVGIIIGAAFGTVVKSLVDNVMMPPIGYLMGGVDFSNLSLPLGKGLDGKTDVVIKYGLFINSIISFVIVAFALFMVIKAMNTAKKRFEKEKEEAEAEPPRQEVLLEEIRDLLKAR